MAPPPSTSALAVLLLLAATAAVASAAGSCAKTSSWELDLDGAPGKHKKRSSTYCLEVKQSITACQGSTDACCSTADRPTSLTIQMDPACGSADLQALKWKVDKKKLRATVASDGKVTFADLGKWRNGQTVKHVCVTIPSAAKCDSFDALCAAQAGHRCQYQIASADGECCKSAATAQKVFRTLVTPMSKKLVKKIRQMETLWGTVRKSVAQFKAVFKADPVRAARELPAGRLGKALIEAAALPTWWDSRQYTPTGSGPGFATGPISIVTPIRDQEQCGTCSAFAATAAAEIALLKTNADTGNAQPPTSSSYLSPYYFYWCVEKVLPNGQPPEEYRWCGDRRNEGGQPYRDVSGLSETTDRDIINGGGLVFDDCRKYQTNAGEEIYDEFYGSTGADQDDINAACTAAKSCPSIPGFSAYEMELDVMDGQIEEATALEFMTMVKQAIMANGSVVAGYMVYPSFGRYVDDVYNKLVDSPNSLPLADQIYTGFKPGDDAHPDDIGGHANAVIGWDDNLQYWLLKNSWGVQTSSYGYVYMAYNAGVGLFGDIHEDKSMEALTVSFTMPVSRSAGGAASSRILPAAGGCVPYTVAAGESLASIAKATGMAVGTLLNDNQDTLKGAPDMASPPAGTQLTVCRRADCAANAGCAAPTTECKPNPFRGGQGECH